MIGNTHFRDVQRSKYQEYSAFLRRRSPPPFPRRKLLEEEAKRKPLTASFQQHMHLEVSVSSPVLFLGLSKSSVFFSKWSSFLDSRKGSAWSDSRTCRLEYWQTYFRLNNNNKNRL